MRSDISTAHSGSHEQIRAIRNNDEKALKFFYRANYPKVEKYVLDNNGTTDEAKDIYQEAFIAMWRNIQLEKFQPKYENALDGYIYQIAKNKWLDHLRTLKRRPVVALSERTGSSEWNEVSDEEEQQLDAVKTKFALLGDMCRDVLERFYYRKESMRIISEALNWTEATAKNNKYRCLQRLRELLNLK